MLLRGLLGLSRCMVISTSPVAMSSIDQSLPHSFINNGRMLPPFCLLYKLSQLIMGRALTAATASNFTDSRSVPFLTLPRLSY